MFPKLLSREKDATLLNTASASVSLDLDISKIEECVLSVEEPHYSVIPCETLFILFFPSE